MAYALWRARRHDYWHVERNSLCIHSQLKSPSSSEVASMVEGVIHHCTEMEVDRQYVDSHGQSTVAFAFCRLLGFQLLPRLKAIHSQKLHRPETGKADAYANLQLILSKPIDALHLIQNCMVYINTLMIQKVLAQRHWHGRLTPRD